jgi:ribose 5-phosphate isomerase A
MMPLSSGQDTSKRAAAARVVKKFEDGMVLGLGKRIDRRIRGRSSWKPLTEHIVKGLRVVGIPTTEATAALGQRFGVPLTNFAEHRHIDVTIGGADQVERGTLNRVKGLSGALLREKILASASDRMFDDDETKLVGWLGGHTPLPVEIVLFAWQTVLDRPTAIGCVPRLRLAGGKPFETDGGNYIADCAIAEMPDPAALEARLSAMVGVVENGLFIDMASMIVVGRPTGVEVIARPQMPPITLPGGS